jgi:basic amino acid/polyamine antiporter, APA family
MSKSLFRRKSVSKILDQVARDGADESHGALSKHLGVKDLTAFGIAAIIGAGIFSTIGKASADGGPAVIFLFLFTAIACGFAAFAYAEFASMVPVSGSAYTYSYVAFGELVAWIIGWALIMEYAIGNSTVAISWSSYFTGLLGSWHIHMPPWMSMAYITASSGFHQAEALLAGGKSLADLDENLVVCYNAWTQAPTIGGLHLIADIPAVAIIILITWLVYRGMKESKNAGNAMVVIKLLVVLLVIAVGAFYVDPTNWHPFAPNGVGGVLKGVSAVFFAYIGFDAISTTAEECKNPQRDLPRGMMWSILICTVLYVAISLVLTGMVKYDKLGLGDPLAYVFENLNMPWMSRIIAVSAVVAMSSVLLVFQMGQPRIWMSMSRDGLLPKAFSKIHPKFKTPHISTIITGFVVVMPTLFMDLGLVTDLCSIGTLFAFVLVCAGVLMLEKRTDIPRGKFRTPYINSRFIMPVLFVVAIGSLYIYNKESMMDFITNKPQISTPGELVGCVSADEMKALKKSIQITDSVGLVKANGDVELYLNGMDGNRYQNFLETCSIDPTKKAQSGWALFKHKIPLWIFILCAIALTILCMVYALSLIPALGLLSCLYMMAELGVSNWIGFGIWLVIGLAIYFSYSYKNSKLNNTAAA